MSEENEDATEAWELEQKFAVAIGCLALLLTFTLGFFLEVRDVHWLPESAGAVVIGAFSVAIMGLVTSADPMDFDMEFFMNWLIPPIIFEAAFNMNVSAFFANILPTLVFAFAGTIFSTFTVAGIVYGAGQL